VAGTATIVGGSGVTDRSMPPMAPSPALGAVYDVQVASYRDLANARRAAEGLRAAGYSPDIQSSGGYHRVLIRALSAEGLERERERLSSLGFPGVIIRLSTPLR
jgi:cell division septation protein DedD